MDRIHGPWMRLSITYHMHWAQVPLSKNMHEIHVLLLSHGSEFFFRLAEPPTSSQEKQHACEHAPAIGAFWRVPFFFFRAHAIERQPVFRLFRGPFSAVWRPIFAIKVWLIFQHFSFFNILKHNSQDYQIIIYGLFQIFASFQDFRTFSLLQISAQIRRISRNSRTYFASL